MFNRSLQVKMVRTPKEAVKADRVDDTYEGPIAIIGYTIDRIVRKAGNVAITYIVLDTLRQVLVAQANKS